MRVYAGDPGSNHIAVYLDGKRLEHCTMADDEKGEAEVYEYPYRIVNNVSARKILHGVVEIIDTRTTEITATRPIPKREATPKRILRLVGLSRRYPGGPQIAMYEGDGCSCECPVDQLPNTLPETIEYESDRLAAFPHVEQPTPTEWEPTVVVQELDGKGCGYFSCSQCPRAVDGNSTVACLYAGIYEHRWPSGQVGVGKPEFRRKPDAATDQAKQLTVTVKLDDDAIKRVLRRARCDTINAMEGGGAPCPHCLALLPSSLVTQITDGTVDCPSCGWREGRCRYCNNYLLNRYRAPRSCALGHEE